MSSSNITPNAATWVIAHGPDDEPVFVAVEPGQTFTTFRPNVEQFSTVEAADARMRDFKPVWRIGPFDLNTSTEQELMNLPGMSPAIAARIFAARPIADVDDISTIIGVTPQRLKTWRPAIFVADETYQAAVRAADQQGPETPPPSAIAIQRAAAELANLRWQQEIGGVTLPDGVRILTTREAQAQLAGAVTALTEGHVTPPIEWKAASGWVDLSAESLRAASRIVARHVQASFASERKVARYIGAEGVTARATLRALFREEYAALMEAA